MNRWRFSVSVVVSVLFIAFYLTGCGPKANPDLTDAEAALQTAIEAGAPELAPEEYRDAEDLLKRARELMAQGKDREARELLKEARYKAIEAAGKARIAKARGQISPEEEASREQELEELRQDLTDAPNMGLQDVFFEYDSSDVTSDARFVLDENAGIINDNSDGLRVVVIEGYCDTRGTEEYNLALGQRRAESAKAYIIGLGVSPSKVEAVSKGETEQWSTGGSESAYQQNRRAHFVPAALAPQAFSR